MKKGFQIKDISKSYDGRPILKKISMELYPGECVGLLGPNGSGKSTLYSTIIGETYADVGGLDQQVQELKEAVELPLTHPELYDEIGIKPPKGVILYGPPGKFNTILFFFFFMPLIFSHPS